MVNLALVEQKRFIGNGRSAKVYLSYHGEKGIATKTFTGEPVSKVILFILTGSANPYTWCEAAIQSAMIRRRLLSSLCKLWFNDRLKLPKTYSYEWNNEQNAFEINAEFIKGQHAPLISPLETNPKDYMAELRQEIMNPLQEKLIQSGFDGLVWQAGKGNPVGASNFMLMKQEAGTHQWIWIDLESGLPALFALNPMSTLFYYLPKCFKHRDWLFDNVDTEKLKKYLENNAESLIKELGLKTYRDLCDDCDLLSTTQKEWKGIKRYKRSLYYAASQDKITPEEKDFYEDKPLRWYLKSLVMMLKAFGLKIKESFDNIAEAVYNFRYRKFFKRIYFYFSDTYYRWGVARWYLKNEVEKWYSRKFITTEETATLKNELKNVESSAYLTDFSIHLGIKPVAKLFALVIMPILIALDICSLQTGTIIIIFAGSMFRTAYTLWRITNNLVKSQKHFPFLALVVGVFPVIGNLAYPVELLYRSAGKKDMLAKFIAYAISSKVGAKIPIWGGKDSETEHFFNRICHKILNFKFS